MTQRGGKLARSTGGEDENALVRVLSRLRVFSRRREREEEMSASRKVIKKKPRFRIEREIGRDRWTRWVQPRPEKYLIKCCDCGLVHELQFRIVGNAQFRARRKRR